MAKMMFFFSLSPILLMCSYHYSLFNLIFLAGNFINTAIAKVPFVDVLEAMEDNSLPLTIHEYDEWGNPNDEGNYHTVYSFPT
jgi:hypothetical protein